MISKKFAFVDDHIQKLLSPLKSSQEFLRLVYYLSEFDSPLEPFFYDGNGVKVMQPDISKTWQDIISDKSIVLTLFNPTILTKEKVTVFFSYLLAKFDDNSLFNDDVIYEMNIVVPYNKIMIPNTMQQRQHRIAKIVCELIDNQPLAGVGNVFCIHASTYKENDDYEGLCLRFKVNDFTKGV